MTPPKLPATDSDRDRAAAAVGYSVGGMKPRQYLLAERRYNSGQETLHIERTTTPMRTTPNRDLPHGYERPATVRGSHSSASPDGPGCCT
jgi:hypothetical protein